MANKPGVATAKKKDGTTYYRASMTIKGKHISLGSYDVEETATKAYTEAVDVFRNGKYELSDYNDNFSLDFDKFVILLNYRNSGVYFKTPIYLMTGYFYYYLSPDNYLVFDREDLFFYAEHKIQIRGGYYFVCDYGSQYSILSRYGIKPYARKGVDYIFVNKNDIDYRYENLKIVNEYVGVTEVMLNESPFYESVIHIKGNFIVGRYPTKEEAAVAYNKAADIVETKGLRKKYVRNYITQFSSEEYKEIYNRIEISENVINYPAK